MVDQSSRQNQVITTEWMIPPWALLDPLGMTLSRPFCNKTESAATKFFIPNPRPRDLADKCNGHKLEGPVCVHIPSLGHSKSSTAKITGGTSRNTTGTTNRLINKATAFALQWQPG